MSNLLNANFFKLKKEFSFWMLIMITIVIAIFTILRFNDNNGIFEIVKIDRILNEYIVYIGLFIAIFVSIFVGKEYANGIIRNKIIVRT